MKITEARVIVSCPGRNFVTLKIVTDEGVTGVGDGTLNGRELAVAAYLRDHVVPLLLDRDPRRIEDTWQFLFQGAYWRRGPVTMTAIAAVDMALWDIVGKLAGLPVHQLLGGRSRDAVTVYAHANAETVEEVLREISTKVAEGYQAVRVQTGIPGIDQTYGVSKERGRYEPADAALPSAATWSSDRYLAFIPSVFRRVREEFGPQLRLLHDVHHRLTPNEAARLGKSLEPYALTWMEDPVPADLQEGYRLIRQHTTTPIAVGEVINSIWDCADLIREQSIDYVRCSVTHAGGITHLRRILDLAALHHVRSGSHGATDLSPISLSAAISLDISIPNFGLQEYMPHDAATETVFPHEYRLEAGQLIVGNRPGLGVDIDEEEALKYTYQPAYLPVNRLQDGTMHPW